MVSKGDCMSKFMEWAQAEANSLIAQHKSATPAVQVILAERLYVLDLVAAKYKEFSGESGQSGGAQASTPTIIPG